jgi:hypothetical protein
MNKAIFTSALVLTYGFAIAQSFTASNYTANIVHPNPFQIVSVPATINNISSSTKEVMVERTINILAPGHTSYFCWGIECYSDTTSMSNPLSAPNITAGGSENSFYFDLDPHGAAGPDTGCYKFFDKNNASDYVEVCFYVDVTTGIANVNSSQANPLSVASPNPANTLSGVNYYADLTKDPRLDVCNLLGEKIFEAKLMQKQGAYIINVEDFKPGIYFYSLIENEKTIATKKLVVAH